MEDKDDDGTTGPRNSFAPNDGYVPAQRKNFTMSDRRSSSRLSRRNSSRISLDMFNNFSYGMLRHMRNPEPSFMDTLMYKVWRKIGLYLPLTGILAMMDFILDWVTSVELIQNDICHNQIFGVMMMITLTFLPMAYSAIKANDDERKLWERTFRFLLGRPSLNPYEKWTPPKDDKVLWYLTNTFYVFFSLWTHVLSQVLVHIRHASKVDYYMEYKIRSKKVTRHLQEGKFVEFDEDELLKLKSLQHRATQYIMYYTKYAKGRLKICLIEDAIQYNIQMALLIFTAYSPHVSRDEFDYSDGENYGVLATMFYATPSTIRLIRLLTRVLCLFTSVLSMWIALYQAERFHEILRTNQPVSLGRILSLALKTVIEILMPTITLVLFAMDRGELIQTGTNCSQHYVIKSIALYMVFPLGYTFVSHFLWAYILNLSNRDDATYFQTFTETLSMSIFSACLTVKYSRIAGNDETTKTEFYAGPIQYLLLLSTNVIKFALPTILIIIGMPKVDMTPTNSKEHHLAVSDSMSFKYEFDYPISDLTYPVIKILDYTDDWQFLPKPITELQKLQYPSLGSVKLHDYFSDTGNNTDGLDILGKVVEFNSTGQQLSYLCAPMNLGTPVGIEDEIKMTICVWGPRRTTNDKKKPHFMVYASFGDRLAKYDISSLATLNAREILPNGKHVYEMRNERLIMLRHAVHSFCNLKKNLEDNKFNCRTAKYYTSFIESNLGAVQDDGEVHLNRMVNFYDVLKYIPPISHTVGALQVKIMLYLFLLYVLFTITYIFAEIDFPIISKTLRYDFLAKFYPYLLPAFLLVMAVGLTYIGIKKSTKAYCQMNPESDQELFFGIVQLDCIEKTVIRTSAQDETEKAKFLSMAKCGLGMFCKYCPQGLDCEDGWTNWRRMATETTEPCLKKAKSAYDYGLLPQYVHGQTWGSLNKLSLDQDDQLTCYFDPELIAQIPIGPDIDPIDCPQVVRRIFKGANTHLPDKYIYRFGFLKTETERILEIRKNRRLIYGESDFPWKNVPQRFPQPTKLLEELTFEDWLAFSWGELSPQEANSFKGESMTTDFPEMSCLQAGNSVIAGMSLYGGVEIGGMLLTEPKKKYFLTDLLVNELTGVLSPDVMMLKNTYAKTVHSVGKLSDQTIDGYENLIQRSLLILVDQEDDLAHRFHQPFEIPYFGWTKFTFEDYRVPTVAEDDCTPDDIYSWDAPFEEVTVTCGGQNVSINHFFGGVPGDRNYTMVEGVQAKTHVGFNGCPAIYNGKMLIFGAGPNMHDYMHEMYNEYYNTWQVNRDRTSDNGCKSRIADQLTDYAKNFWQSDSNTDQATFKYLAPKEFYGAPSTKTSSVITPITGYAKCTIRHAGQNYGRNYFGVGTDDNHIHRTNSNIRSCALQARGKLRMGAMGNEGYDVASSHDGDLPLDHPDRKGLMGSNGYRGPTPVKFFFVDLTGDKVAKFSDSATQSKAYSEDGFTHPRLGPVFRKFSFVLPVHGINMEANKRASHLHKAAETVATGQIIQAIIQNEGFDQIFSYLFTFKNCEKHDLEFTNLFKATVHTANTSLTVESIRKDLAATDYATLMRTKNVLKNGSYIGSYKGQNYRRNITKAVADWEDWEEPSSLSGQYSDNSEYSFYRWTYFFDYEEQDYNKGPEVPQTPDDRFSEETRLSNALLWLRDYDNSQSRRRYLLKSSYLINRFSYPDSNQDGRKFIHGETHNEDAFSVFSPIAFAENPLSFVTPLRSERTDSANELSQFVNDVMYTPQRWGVYPFKGVSMKYHQPVMEEYSPDLLNVTATHKKTNGPSSNKRIINHVGHFWNWTYDDCGDDSDSIHWLTTMASCIQFTDTQRAMMTNKLGSVRNLNEYYWPMSTGYFWYWLNKSQEPVEGYLATTAKPHCFLASDHDIGGFFEPFYRNQTHPDIFQGQLNMTKYLEQNTWGQPNAIWRPDDPYFKDDYKEGPLTIMMNKSMFDAKMISKIPSISQTTTNTEYPIGESRHGAFNDMDPWKYGRYVHSSSKQEAHADGASSAVFKFGQDLPWLSDRDRWYRQCNFLKSIELLNFNLDNQTYTNSYHQFNTTTFDDDFSVDNDGFLDAMLNLNKPCPVFENKVWLFGRIRKTQEVRSRNTEEFNWNHLRQAGLRHATAGKIMPLRLSVDKWLNNDVWNKTVLHVYGKHLEEAYGIPLFNDDDHVNLEIPLYWDKKTGRPEYGKDFSPPIDPMGRTHPLINYGGDVNGWDTANMFQGFTHREVANTIPTVWGMNITKGNEMYVPPVYGSNYGLSMFNDVEKTYPHPYTVAFTYDGSYTYRGMVPNSISPQWGACVNYKTRLICLGGMICYHHSRKNAAFTRNRVVDRHDDSLLCDNMDDAPHNMAISPKQRISDSSKPGFFEWDTSLSNEEDLGSFSLPVGLLGHSAIVINNNGIEQIHVFGGMWGKLSNYAQFKNFYDQKDTKATSEQFTRRYRDLYDRDYLQSWDNSVATQTPQDRRVGVKFRPNQIWAPADVSYAITHNAVGKLSLVYESGKWHRGPQMKNRRFGHTSVYYTGQVYHIGGHYADGISNSMESWLVNDPTAESARTRREVWEEGIPYNPKPFLYDGWSYTNFDHDPTLQNYFFRNGQTYTNSASIFKDEQGNDLSQTNDFNINDFFNGSFVNEFHPGQQPFFENVREAYMSEIKYAPCKYCIFDSSYNQSDSTTIQSLANSKIYKWNASIPPKKGYEWNVAKASFEYMKFDINRMQYANTSTSIFGDEPMITESNTYFNSFVNFFPTVFNVPTKHVPETFNESVSLDVPQKVELPLSASKWLPDCQSPGDLVILPGLSLCNSV